MKIAFLTEDIFGIGGVQRVVSTLANALVPENEVSIICINKSVRVDREIYQLDERVKVLNPKELHQINQRQYFKKGLRYINKKYIGSKNVNFLKYIYITASDQDILTRFFEDNHFDAIVAIQLKLSMLLGAVADKIPAKCYGWEHNTYDAYFETPHKYYWNQHRLAKKYLALLDGCIVLSEKDASHYAKNLGIQAKCIYNPVRITKSLEAKKDAGWPKKVLFVSRLVKEQKGLDYLIEIIKKCSALDYSFEIIGDGPDREYIENQVRQNKLDGIVKVCGATKMIQDYYQAADLIISTSRWEGFGLTLVEAMQFGVPFVAFENAGSSEILGGSKAGIIVKKYDIDAFVEGIHWVLDDDSRYKMFSQEAVRRYKDFAPEAISAEWIKYISED